MIVAGAVYEARAARTQLTLLWRNNKLFILRKHVLPAVDHVI